MWVLITLAIIVAVVFALVILITLPMCKEYDELFSRDEQSAQTKENSGTSAFDKN